MNTTTHPTKEDPMVFSVYCPCCGQVVEARDAGFAATTVDVAACDARRSEGIVSWTMRKSAAIAAIVTVPGLRHREGLVTLG